MLTLEVNGQLVTWPEEFAMFMMRCYRTHGVAVTIHRNCIHSGCNVAVEKRAPMSAQVRRCVFKYAG